MRTTHTTTRLAGLGFMIGLAALLGGCESMSNTGKGVVGGSVIGGAIGTGVGFATGNPRTGAAVGAALGAGVGGVIGNEKDAEQKKRDDEIKLAQAQADLNNSPSRGPLSVQEIVQLAQSKVSDAIIINQIRSTRSVYNLGANDLQYLQQSGVSDAVVQEMQATRNRAPVVLRQPRPVYVEEQPQVVVVRPAPYYVPPPVGFGFNYVRVR